MTDQGPANPSAVRRGWVIGGVTAATLGSSRGRILSTAVEIALPLYLTVLLWRGLYAGQQEVAGVTHDQAVTYAVIAALLTYLRIGNRALVRDAMIQHIRQGTIVYWFLWPMRPAAYHLVRGVGDLAYAMVWVIPAYLICLVLQSHLDLVSVVCRARSGRGSVRRCVGGR